MIVGFTGFKRSGKDTAGQALIDNGFEHIGFADELKRHLLILNPQLYVAQHSIEAVGLTNADVGNWNLRELVERVGWDRAKLVPEVRRLMQVYGTEVVRDNFGYDTWVNLTLAKLDPTQDYVVTDVRFPNEQDAIYSHGGVVFRITRDGVEGASDTHDSEQVLDNIDCGILNNGTIEALRDEVLARVREVSVKVAWQTTRSNRTEDDDWEPVVPDRYGIESKAAERTHLQDMMLEAAERNGEMPSDYLMRTVHVERLPLAEIKRRYDGTQQQHSGIGFGGFTPDAFVSEEALQRAYTADRLRQRADAAAEAADIAQNELERAHDDLEEWVRGQGEAHGEYLRNLPITGPSYPTEAPIEKTVPSMKAEVLRLRERAADLDHEARLREYAESHGVEWPNTPEGEALLLKAGARLVFSDTPPPVPEYLQPWDVTP